MKAAVMVDYGKPLEVREVEKPKLTEKGAIIKVMANGICRSDLHLWHGDVTWGHVDVPHILGHEVSGIVEEVGSGVHKFKKGDRIVVPFSGSCGVCDFCTTGHNNVCDNPQYPGVHYSGGFGEYIHVPNADINLVHLPDNIDFVDAAGMGCRFMTAFHGVIDQAEVRPGQWFVVNGCGGVGLSAVHIASAIGANVIAVDIDNEKLEFAKKLGAKETLNAKEVNVPEKVHEITGKGADASLDALGIPNTCQASILSLRKRGTHLQIGLTSGKEKGLMPIPSDIVVNKEIKVIGSMGMPPSRYPDMLRMVSNGILDPGKLVINTVDVEGVSAVLESMNNFGTLGVTVLKWY